MSLSKSKYCRGITCPKMLWLDVNNPEVGTEINNEAVFENGKKAGELAKKLFGENIDIPFSEDLSLMLDKTNKVIENNESAVITEASFCFDNNFCSVDILKKKGNSYEIYEVKSSTKVKDIYIDDVSYQYYVLTKLEMNVEKVCVVYINSFYERNGDLDLNSLFNIEDVTEIAKSKYYEIEKNINSLNNILSNKKEPNNPISKNCISPYECPYFAYCTSNLEKPNIFDLKRLRSTSKFKLFNEGIVSLSDLKNSGIEEKVRVELDYKDKKEDLINKESIKGFLNTLSYPLYFLDFETFQEVIPSLDKQRPYEQVPFQYSLHYIENDELKHKEFLAYPGVDPRRALAEKLCEDIPMDVCSLAYNMNFEKSVIKRLANIYPDLKKHLMNIHDNMKDLMVPFYNMDYYNGKMAGSYSIKYVLPALFPDDPELDYHTLEEVHNGSEAMNAYFMMHELNGKDLENLRNNLLKYCKLDTYAMVKILEKLKEVE